MYYTILEEDAILYEEPRVESSVNIYYAILYNGPQ